MSLFGKKTEEEKKDVQSTAAKDAEPAAVTPEPQEADAVMPHVSSAVLVAPVVTEKSHALAASGKYVFRITKSATKRAVKKAVEDTYDVHVTSVHVVHIPAKRRTVKYNRGYQSSYKKAIVTLQKGETISLFETA